MPFSVSPVVSIPFTTPIVPETQRSPDRQHAQDEARRRNREHPEAGNKEEVVNGLSEAEPPPTRGTLIDVLA